MIRAMFDFAWSEMALIGVVALIVIGPKDLPRVLRTAGTWVRKARAIAREFQGSIDQMVRDAELDEVRQQVQKATDFNLDHEIVKTIDPEGDLGRALGDPVLANPMAEPVKQVEPPGEPAALAAPSPAPALPEASPAPPPHAP
jgi:sec-independent protein translocase protein TatB